MSFVPLHEHGAQRSYVRPFFFVLMYVSLHVSLYVPSQGMYITMQVGKALSGLACGDVYNNTTCTHVSMYITMQVGKDLSMLACGKVHLPARVILFDDKASNFTPQPHNGVHVRRYRVLGCSREGARASESEREMRYEI